MLTASVVLDTESEYLVGRLSSKIYEGARAGVLQIPGFPKFDSVLAALKADDTVQDNKPYQVCCRVGDSLKVLETLAQCWLENEHTQDRARKVIEEHNKRFNTAGDLMKTQSRTPCAHEVPTSSGPARKEWSGLQSDSRSKRTMR